LGFQTFAGVFHDDARGAASAGGGLAALADDRNRPAFVRASALARLARHPSADAVRVAMASLGDANPLTRRSALGVFEALPPRDRLAIIAALGDSSRSVRIEAARVLAPAASAIVGVEERDRFTQAANEFIASQRASGDRPEARTNLGTFLAQLGRTDEAVVEFRAAIRLAPAYVPAYVNLADAYAQQGNEAAAEQALRDGIGRDSRNADLLHALGLSLARSRRTAEAVDALAQAAALAPDVARFSYAHAVALHSTGRADDALRVISAARQRHPADRDLLFALATFQRDKGRSAEALQAAEELVRLYPADADAAALRQSLATPAAR
jgi:Flp pilus assembly protein TadD